MSPNTVKNSVKAIKSFFFFLHDRGIIPSDPTAKIGNPRIPKTERVCPTEGEVAKFLPVLAAAKNPKAKTMLFLFMNTGIRFTEMATLPWGKVDLENCKITVLGKGGKRRTVPIATWLRDFLAELHHGHTDDELLFPTISKTGKWDNTAANRMIARLCRQAGIKKYTCHQFRHYFATHTLKLGGDKTLKHVQEMLGHERAATTIDLYYHITDEEEIRKTHEAFAPLAEGKPKEEKGGSNHGQTN
ncbi:Tyrosine recombinase XerD [subsurface metagenome]